jgi:hypothetical protein
MYESSEVYNLPPFDAYGGKVELLKKDGRWFLSKETSHNKNEVQGDMEYFGDQLFMVSPSGYRSKVFNENGKYFIRSRNCTNSVFHILREEIGLDLGHYLAAKSAHKALLEGTTQVTPDAIVKY